MFFQKYSKYDIELAQLILLREVAIMNQITKNVSFVLTKEQIIEYKKVTLEKVLSNQSVVTALKNLADK